MLVPPRRALGRRRDPPCTPVAAPTDIGRSSANWAQTLERIASGVVTIQIDSTRAFDTEWNTTAQATGFVIDAKRGLILTNRHVVTPGPVTAQATFQNREEVQLYPVYRDPVHDFGIYHYDPAKLRFIQPAELPLYPAGAVIGREIRVVGNDAGEQLSILAGTLARLDREAPEYGYGKYNDFNTFYYPGRIRHFRRLVGIAGHRYRGTGGGAQCRRRDRRRVELLSAAAGGHACAEIHRCRQAGAARHAWKPYSNTRPTMNCAVSDSNPDTEARMRSAYPKLTGMLVVDEVQPGSAADGVLSPGDILVSLDGKPVPEFFALEDVLDNHVGQHDQRGDSARQRNLAACARRAVLERHYRR